MPLEITKHSAVLEAINSINAIKGITSTHNGHFEYEIDFEVTVYGRNYNGKKVGPYVRLLTYKPGEDIVREGEWGGNTFYFVVNGRPEVYVKGAAGEAKVAELPTSAQFGEMSVLAGVPRAATVRAPQNAEVQILEVQRPALRLLRKIPEFGGVLDSTYRRYGRSVTLQDLASNAPQLTKEVIKQIEQISEFKVFSKNHILFRAGEPIHDIYVLKSGWIRLAAGAQVSDTHNGGGHDWSKKADENFVGPSHCFGLEGITRQQGWPQTGILLGRSEVLEISLAKLRQHPELRDILLKTLTPLIVPQELATNRPPLPVAAAQEAVIETGLVDGTNLLLMDMKLCVRCGNCSMACHEVHGQSRLLRRGVHITRPEKFKIGASFQSLLSPSVCMHCQDPECLTGCPTGAIGRFSEGQVGIDPKTCIGCGDCATQCPYNAITMLPRRAKEAPKVSALQSWLRLAPEPLPPAVETTDDLVANKCNLCAGTGLNPPGAKTKAYSCEENCPTGALLRVDPHTYFSEIRQIEGIAFRDNSSAVASHTSHKDRGKQLMHLVGLALTLALTALTIVGMVRFGLDKPLVGTWLDVRWLTGLVGLVGIAGVMVYPYRRRIYKRRAGPLRYWMLSHTWLGVIAGVILLLHGGAQSGGALTTALMISFDLVILTGLFGIFCYLVAPRMLTRIEGQPLLIEDLTARREELSNEIGTISASVTDATRAAIERKVLPKFLSIGFLMRQYLKREALGEMTESARREFQSMADSLPQPDRAGFLQVVEKAATMRRVDSLVGLHQTLKLWLAPHVLLTSLMLALMLVHIIQVIYFAGR